MTKSEQKIVKALAWNRDTLGDWYLASIANDIHPIWTEEHLDELFKDFYLIKK